MTTKSTRRTSDRVSTIAANLMSDARKAKKEWGSGAWISALASDVLALAGSCLTQDEHRGKRKAKRKSARKGKR